MRSECGVCTPDGDFAPTYTFHGGAAKVRRYPTRTLASTLRCAWSGSGSGSGSGFGSGSGSGRVPLVSLGSQLGHTEPVRLVEHCYPGLAEPSGLRMSQPAPQWRGEVRGRAGKRGSVVGRTRKARRGTARATRNGTPPRPKAARCPVRKRGLVDPAPRRWTQPQGGGPGPKEVDPAQRGWGYNPPNTCAMRIFATIATG